jgi:NitT/TauT family transport system substrate-binding protein
MLLDNFSKNNKWLILNRRKFFKYGTLATTGFAIAACTNQSKSSTQTKQLKSVKMSIPTWVGYGPLFVAQEKELFKQHGLDVELTIVNDTGALRTALTAQKIQFTATTADTFAIESAQGYPATCVMKLDESYGGDGIVATKEIATIADLKGKTVAVEKGSVSQFFLLYLLKKEGIAPKDVKITFTPGASESATAFVGGNADAAVTWEPYVTESTKNGNSHVLVTSREKSGLLIDILVVHKDYGKENPDAVKGMMKSWFDGLAYWQTNQAEANAIIAKALNVPNSELAEMLKGIKFADYKENQAYFKPQENTMSQYLEVFTMAQNIWLEEGLIDKTVDAKTVTDTSFLETLYS